MKITVSELIVKYLERLGIEYIFGMPGSHILPVYDSLYDSSIKSVLAKHEQGAAFMASGYSRASGKVSACITTAGPGATNLVTGIANAYADKQPILIITGETSTHIFGKGGLQESSGEGGSIDQVSLFKGITKYNRIVERTDYLANVLNRASKILLSPNSGPVLLSFPFNVQKDLVDDNALDQALTDTSIHSVYESFQPIEALTDLLAKSEHPVIVAGYGCIKSGAQQLVTQISEILNIPVSTSLKGRGVISEHSALSLGSLGVTSSGYAHQYIVEQSDLIIFLGAGFNERTSYLWDRNILSNKKIIQVDSDYEQLEKVFKADIAINEDIKQFLTGLLNTIKQGNVRKKHFAELQGNLEDAMTRPSVKNSNILSSEFSIVGEFFTLLEQNFPDGTMIFDDNIIFAQNYFNVSDEGRYYPNSGISSLGHAIPAAIGGRFSVDIPTFAILGDGGFQMCCMEIMTAVNYRLPLNIVMFNNSTMGLIRKTQSQQYNKRFLNCDFVNPDYQYLSRSFGIDYYKVEKTDDLDIVFSNCDFSSAINLIEIVIDKNAFPNYTSKR